MNKQALEQSVRYADANAKSVLSHRIPSKALIADLSEQSFYEYNIPQAYLEKYAGGPALGARLWADFAGYSSDDDSCLEAENPIVIIPSIAGTDFTSIVFRSPATGNLAFNNFYSSITVAPFTALVILGRFKKKGVVRYSDSSCIFEFNEALEDKNISEINSLYPGCIASGRGGDNALLFASCVYNNQLTGRGGLGYVFGAKNIKVLLLKKEEKQIVPETKDNMFIQFADRYGWAPINNFSLRSDPRLFYLCTGKNAESVPYDVRLMLGSNCNTFDISKIQQRYRFCIENSLDPISVGNILGKYQTEHNEVDFKDNNQVMNILDMMLKGSVAVDTYSINGLECGPYDYRGSFAQALSDGLGNNIPVYFALNGSTILKNHAKLVYFNEMLVYGLQSLGTGEKVIVSLFDSNSKRVVAKHRISAAIARSIKSDVSFKSILKIGDNCRTLIRCINSHLRVSMPSIPDYFCIDPECNHSDKTVVPFRTLLNDYSRLCNKVDYGEHN